MHTYVHQYKQKAACTVAGVAQGSAEVHVEFYLALFLAQFSEHLWLLLQVSQQQRQCRGTGVMSSKQQIEGNVLHTKQVLISVLPYVNREQVCLQLILALISGFMPESEFRVSATGTRWTFHQRKQIHWG